MAGCFISLRWTNAVFLLEFAFTGAFVSHTLASSVNLDPYNVNIRLHFDHRIPNFHE